MQFRPEQGKWLIPLSLVAYVVDQIWGLPGRVDDGKAWYEAIRDQPLLAVAVILCLLGIIFLFWPPPRRGEVQKGAAEIKAEFGPGLIPECVNTFPTKDGGRWTQWRVKVTALNDDVENCSGVLSGVQYLSGGKPEGTRYVERVPLSWNYPDINKMTIRRGMDVGLSVILMRDGHAEIERLKKEHYRRTPFHTVPGDYEVRARIFASNAEPKEVTFVFHWTGLVSTSQFSNVRIATVEDGTR
jgi:hypothetical protein